MYTVKCIEGLYYVVDLTGRIVNGYYLYYTSASKRCHELNDNGLFEVSLN